MAMARSEFLVIGDLDAKVAVSVLRSAWVGWAKDKGEARLKLEEGRKIIFFGDLKELTGGNLAVCMEDPMNWVTLVSTVDEIITLAQEETKIHLVLYTPGLQDEIDKIRQSPTMQGIHFAVDLGRLDKNNVEVIAQEIIDIIEGEPSASTSSPLPEP